jgi:hypothetical protein
MIEQILWTIVIWEIIRKLIMKPFFNWVNKNT